MASLYFFSRTSWSRKLRDPRRDYTRAPSFVHGSFVSVLFRSLPVMRRSAESKNHNSTFCHSWVIALRYFLCNRRHTPLAEFYFLNSFHLLFLSSIHLLSLNCDKLSFSIQQLLSYIGICNLGLWGQVLFCFCLCICNFVHKSQQ
jgi:hypothetical protein